MEEHDPRWVQVGRQIDQRMTAAGITQAAIEEAGGPSEKTLRRYLAGFPIKRKDLVPTLCAALRWTPDSIQRILDGGAPVELDGGLPQSELAQVLHRLERLEREVFGNPDAGVVIPMRPVKPKPPPPPAVPAKKAAKKRPTGKPRME